MSNQETDGPKNQFEGVPLRVLMFLNLRDGGGGPEKRAPAAAEFYGLSIDELKAECRTVAESWIDSGVPLSDDNARVYEWAKS